MKNAIMLLGLVFIGFTAQAQIQQGSPVKEEKTIILQTESAESLRLGLTKMSENDLNAFFAAKKNGHEGGNGKISTHKDRHGGGNGKIAIDKDRHDGGNGKCAEGNGGTEIVGRLGGEGVGKFFK